VLLAASRRKALELVDEILRNVSLFHRDRRRDRKVAHVSVEMEELLVGVGPAQKAWMSGTGLEQVKTEERCWQRSTVRDSRDDAERQISCWCGEKGDLGRRVLGRDGASAWSQRAGPAKRAEDVRDPEQVGSSAILAAGNGSAGSVACGEMGEDLRRPAGTAKGRDSCVAQTMSAILFSL
jgi:hypothetical protein